MPSSGEHESPLPDPETFETDDVQDADERLERRSAFATTLAQHGFPDTLVLSRERSADVFHERRLELIDHLANNEPASVRALADALGYDKGLVSRDLRRLARIDVIEYEKRGQAKAPRLKHRHIAVEPIV